MQYSLNLADPSVYANNLEQITQRSNTATANADYLAQLTAARANANAALAAKKSNIAANNKTEAYNANLASNYSSGGNSARVGGGKPLGPHEQWIVDHESGGRTDAQNPTSTAFGLGQLLLANRQKYAAQLGIKNPNTTNYNAQVKMFRAYVASRYGTAKKAEQFWKAHNWY